MSKKEGINRRVLYIGLDDSNHGNYPELALAYFSTITGDFLFDNFSFRRDPNLLNRLQSPKRDYRFLLFSQSDIVQGLDNLAVAGPSLIFPFIEQKGPFEGVVIGIDGHLNSASKSYLKQELSDYFETISVNGFIKYKQGHGKDKSYSQPRILAWADAQVHHLASTLSLKTLQAHEKRVPLRQ
jgi:hypothetical protein